MNTTETTGAIQQALHTAQRQTIVQAALNHGVQASWWILPAAAVAIVVDARWLGGTAGVFVLALALLAIVAWSAKGALQARRDPIAMAILLDQRAGYKSRVSTALAFLKAPLDGPRELQVRDAMAYMTAFDWRHHFALRWPRGSAWAPLLALLAVAAMWVPPAGGSTPPEDAIADSALRAAQAAELAAARDALADALDSEDPMAEEIQADLQELAEQLESGALDERQVMIALSRMEAALAARMQQGDLAALAQEAQSMAAPLQTSQTTAEAGHALARSQPAEAGESLMEAGRSAQQQGLSDEDRAETAQAMRAAAARLRESGGEDGQPRAGNQSFAHDLEGAAESLEQADGEAFNQSMEQMAGKLNQVQQYQNMEAMRQGMEDARSSMAMADGSAPEMGGMDMGAEGDDSGRGGTLAGTGTDPNLMGDPQRLEQSMRELIAVRGQLGDGPVETRIEATEGRLSQSAVDVREIHAEYAAVAEEAIERESVPLSHRQHVRRYFEAIRPPAEQSETAAP